jgi:hypothetical protein
MLRKPSILFVAATLAGAIPAFAVDGQILINRASVMAAGGFPFSIFQSGSYKLSGNLQVPAGKDGIQISASHVTLDLNGFTIQGAITCQGKVCSAPPTDSSNGIVFVGDETVIRNGHIAGFSIGISGLLLTVGTIEDVHISQNMSFGIFATNSLVRRNDISANGGLGLACGACAVIENVVAFNAGGGVNLGGGTFLGNVVDSNQGTNAFIAATVVSAHNNNCNDSGC